MRRTVTSRAAPAMRRAVFRLRIRLAGSWAPYRRLTRALRWWPLGLPRSRRSARRPADPTVAYLVWRYPILAETMIQREIEGLRQAGLQITVLAQEPEPGVSPLSDLAARNVVYLGPPDRRRARRLLRRFLLRRPLRTANLFLYVVSRRHGPRKSFAEDRRVFLRAVDVAAGISDLAIDHLHAPWAGHEAFVALVASRLAGVTYSVHARAYDLHRAAAVYALPEKLRHARFAVTNSRFNQAHIRRLLGDAGFPVHRIYNGVDPDRLHPDRDRARNRASPHILSVGRLVPQKGFEVLLEACARLRERGVVFRCDIIGAPEEAHAIHHVALRRLHRRLELEDTVRFLGGRTFPEVEAAYRSADVFALPSIVADDGARDITPNALLEAMAMELPVVSTPVGAIPEIVDDTSGLLVEPGDVEALSEALERLLLSADLRRELGRAARAKVLARFDIRENTREYLGLFRGVTGVSADRFRGGPLPAEGAFQE